MKKTVTILVIIGAVIIIFLILGPFYTVQEGEQAVVVQFGKIVKEVKDAGLKIKLPLIERVEKYSKKILSWDGEAQRLPTAENQFIWVDTTARWKIVDPKKFYESVGTVAQAQSRLDDVISSDVKKVISGNKLVEAVRNSNVINQIARVDVFGTTEGSSEEGFEDVGIATFTVEVYPEINAQISGRTNLSDNMLQGAAKITDQYGVELIDIIIRQIKYSDQLTENVHDRMIQERKQIAQAFRSDGEGQKADWLGRMERELLSIQSGAYREAQEIKGGADALAAAVYAEAYNQDTEFFKFWRAVESYRVMMPKFQKILTTEPEYFDYLYGQFGNE